MKRALTVQQVKSKKNFKTFAFTGEWFELFGAPEEKGMWLIYGNEKNGKTTFAVQLAEYLSSFKKTLYLSAEEGMSKAFVEAIDRATKNERNTQLHFTEYESLDDLSERIKAPRAPKVILIDNVTMYLEELKNGGFRQFTDAHPNRLFIFIAHAEGMEPYGATGKMIKRLAQIVIRVEGLKAFIGGRCPGGTMEVTEQNAKLYHGTEQSNNQSYMPV